MASRYVVTGTSIPQPKRKIIPSSSDIIHVLRMGERIDNLAKKYYLDQTLGWIIMCGNPQFDNEFEIPIGYSVRIPFPLSRVNSAWQISEE